MMKFLPLVLAVLQFTCTPRAQPSGSGQPIGSGSAMLPRPCHDAGYSSCCPGRNDSCLGNPPNCYCDEYCLRTMTDDCCEDLIMGLLKCETTISSCAVTLEERVRGLAELQTVLSETYVGLPDHFRTTQLYLQALMRQVTNLYSAFDTNNTDTLDRHEFHLLFQGILSDSHTNLGICEEDFLSFCDTDQDHSVSEGELEQCTGVVPYCNTVDDTAALLASELLVSQLQPVFADVVSREQFANSVFPFSDRQDPRGLLNLDEFQMLYGRLIELYNILPSVCPQSVFALCNSNNDLFITLEEVISCGSKA